MYVNTYLLAVPENNKARYLKLSETYAQVAREFGALEICENWELEVPDGESTDYRRAVKAQPGEKIVISWVIWPDRETAARAHKGMFADSRLAEFEEIPFDGRRMIQGGFEPLLYFREK